VILALALMLQESAKLEQEIEVANAKDKPQMHSTACKRLAARGGPAVEEAVEAFVAKRGAGALSLAFTETLGELRSPKLTARLRALAVDPAFFWRPAAMRALAKHADSSTADVFRGGLADKLWGVRMGAIQGIERLKDRESLPRVRELLGDEQYDVRAQAAKTLHAFGDPSGLPVLVEALRADTVWFDIDFGQIAREDAWNFLKGLTGDDFGYKPWEGPEARAPGLAKFEAWIAKTAPDWRDRLPEKARVRAEKVEYVFGYELRSCQRGDVFFRLDAEGNLVLGYFNLEKAKLAPAELKAFLAEVEKARTVDRTQPYGEGGCDYEQMYFKAGGRFEKLWIGQRGRPEAVEPFVKTAAALLKAKFGERVAEDFRYSSLLFRAAE
jgi:hypothetical protein